MSRPGPLRLQPKMLPKVWAAEALPQPHQSALGAPPGTGEVWLASARLHITKVAGGEHAGLGLDEVTERWHEWVLGPGGGDGFPLLVKLLNVGQWLSVQVHPDDVDARRLENEPWGKSEAWHVLAAEAGAEIIHGLRPGVDREEVAERVAQHRLPEVLARVPARAGDTFHLPAGTVHATGPGLFILEVQQASDVTYRFYDWDRVGDDGKPRELHQDKALQVMRASGPGSPVAPQEALASEGAARSLLVSDPHFSLHRCYINGTWRVDREPAVVRVLYIAAGAGRMASPDGAWAAEDLAAGQCWLIPAGVEQCRITGQAGELIILEAAAAPAT